MMLGALLTVITGGGAIGIFILAIVAWLLLFIARGVGLLLFNKQ